MLISIIIPMRNEVKFVAKCLDSLRSQTGPSEEVEILCVDGRSTDGTREIVAEMAEKDKRIKLLDNPQKIVPTAMNIGIKASRGKYVARVDCHSTFAPDYIAKCIEVMQRTGADGVGGYIGTIPGKNTAVGKAIAAATSCVFGVGNARFRLRGPEQEVDTVPFGAYRREIFDEIGLYDERLVRNQDIELNSRIRKAGGHIIISPEMKLSYYNRATYTGLWQQSFNNGLWNPYTVWLVGSSLSLRHFVPMFFVLGLIAVTVGAFFSSLIEWMLLGYALLYLAACFAFSIQRAHQTKTSTLLIVCSFVVLHIAYGLGSLWAIVTMPFKFPNRHTKIVGEPLADRRT